MPLERQRRRGSDQEHRDAAEQEQDGPNALRAQAHEKIAEAHLLFAKAERAASVREIYSTRKGAEPPEYLGRHREWVRACPTILGSYKTTPDSRWWCISRRDYERHVRSVAVATPVRDETTDAAPAWSPAQSLRDLGYRPGSDTKLRSLPSRDQAELLEDVSEVADRCLP
jgi:hypothetical protein